MKPVIRTYLYTDDNLRFFGDGPLTLLRSIEKNGSLRAAAQEMQMAYTKAHTIIARAEQALGIKLTQKSIGGKGGGGSQLTPEALALIRDYQTFKNTLEKQAEKSYAQIFKSTAPPAPIIGGILMASGFSKRFGANKLLTHFKGIPLFHYGLRALEIPELHRKIVVTRYAEIAAHCLKNNVPYILHQDPAQSDTIRHGIGALSDTDGCLFLPADLPFLTGEHLRTLIRAFSDHPEKICRLTFRQKNFGPAIFPHSLYHELVDLQGESGGSLLFRHYPEKIHYVEIDQENAFFDIDTPQTFEQLSLD